MSIRIRVINPIAHSYIGEGTGFGFVPSLRMFFVLASVCFPVLPPLRSFPSVFRLSSYVCSLYVFDFLQWLNSIEYLVGKRKKSRKVLCVSEVSLLLHRERGVLAHLARARHWQCRGERFESAMLHHPILRRVAYQEQLFFCRVCSALGTASSGTRGAYVNNYFLLCMLGKRPDLAGD